MSNYIDILNSFKPILSKEKVNIYLIKFEKSRDFLLKELGKVRYNSFKAVGIGVNSDNNSDLDEFDLKATHLILWHKDNNEIVGGYRLFKSSELINSEGIYNTYLSDIFDFSEEFKKNIPLSAEVGRSFVAEKYWRGNYLDLLWCGIGKFLLLNSHIRYLYGTISMSNNYSENAIALILNYYRKWYYLDGDLVFIKSKYRVSNDVQDYCDNILNGMDSKEDFVKLKKELIVLRHAIPVLFRKYIGLTEEKGTLFLGFGVDEDFNSIAALLRVDLTMINESFRSRYLI